jgi:hypothetical protein
MTEVFEIRSAPPAGSPLSPRAGAIWCSPGEEIQLLPRPVGVWMHSALAGYSGSPNLK